LVYTNNKYMSQLTALTRENVSEDNQAIFDNLKSAIGMVPNLYATYANSPVALKAILEFGDTLGGGSFSKKEIEAVALAISQANDCEYCLAAHTALGKMNGFSEEETVSLRNLTIEDDRLSALTQLAADITVTRGRPEQAKIDAFYSAGYDKAAFVELIGLVSLNTYNNYLNHLAGTEVDFPLA